MADLDNINTLLGTLIGKVDAIKEVLDKHIDDTKDDMSKTRKYTDLRVSQSEARTKESRLTLETQLGVNIDDAREACAAKWVETRARLLGKVIIAVVIIALGSFFTFKDTNTSDDNKVPPITKNKDNGHR